MITLGASQLFKAGINLRQRASQSLTVGVEVGVVVDIYGDSEFFFQKGTQRHTIAERWEVGQIETTYDAIGIVGRARECKADGYGLVVELCYDALEAIHHSGHTTIQVVGIGWQSDGIYNEFVGTDA